MYKYVLLLFLDMNEGKNDTSLHLDFIVRTPLFDRASYSLGHNGTT